MDLKFILEAILFHAQKPLSSGELRELLTAAALEASEDVAPKEFKKTRVEAITTALEELEREHAMAQRSYRLACVAGAWQFVSQGEYAPWLRVLYGIKARPPRLSQPALETLAIIAYRQPITRTEIEHIRGVSVDGVMQTLLERGLIVQVGRAEVVGRPGTYGTTAAFLEYFGLRNLEELPAADELRRVEVKKPEGLLTVEPGLATQPPEALANANNSPEPAADTVEAAAPPHPPAAEEPPASGGEPPVSPASDGLSPGAGEDAPNPGETTPPRSVVG